MKLEWSKPIHYGGDGSYDWPKYEGVYVIAKKSGDKLKAIYVGQGEIDENMKKHEGKNEQNKCLLDFMKKRNKETKVFHAKITNDEDRNDAEFTIYNYYGGKEKLCNENDPPLGKIIYTLNFPFDKIELND